MRRLTGVISVISVLAVAAFFRLYRLDSIPPGLWRDEARDGLDVIGILHGHTPIFFEEREPLFMYLLSVSVAFFGRTDVAMRLVPALIGIATVGLTYALAHKLFDKWVGLLAAFGLATSFWDIDISRLALRANAVPLFVLLSFYSLWVGLQRDKEPKNAVVLFWPFALTGFFLGTSFYTYLSARLLPLVFVLFLAWMMVLRRITWRRGFLILIAIGLVSLIVFVPLGLYFLSDPSAFINHTSDTSFFGSGPGRYSDPASFLINIANTLGMFTSHGDLNWRHNIPYRPVFDPISSIFFVAGILYSFYRIRRGEYSFVVIWLIVMLLPGILSIDSPHYLRTLATAPAAYMMAAIGIAQIGRWVNNFVSRHRFFPETVSRLYLVAIAGLLVMVTVTAYRDYFQSWAKDPTVYAAFEADVTDSAKFLNTVQGEPLVFASAVYVPHPATLYISRTFQNLRWFDSSQALVIPSSSLDQQSSGASAQEAIFILLGPDSPWLPMLQKIYPDGKVIASGKRPDGATSFLAYSVPDFSKTVGSREPSNLLTANLGGEIQLIGYDLQGTGLRNNNPTVKPGQTLTLTLYWKPMKPVHRGDLKFFTHLTDIKLNLWGQKDDIGYPSSQWRGGELVVNRFDIKVSPGAPAGKYTLALGSYYQSSMERLQVANDKGQQTGDTISLLPIKVLALSNEPPALQSQSPAIFAGRAQLLGYDLASDGKTTGSEVKGPLKASDRLGIKLYWKGLSAMKEDYTVFLHLSRPDGEVVAQSDSQPGGGGFPTSFWDEGEYVTDPHEMALPSNLSPGDYNLVAGMYLLSTGERLKTDSGADSVQLGTITIGK